MFKINTKRSTHRKIIVVHWNPPNMQRVKLNCDGASKGNLVFLVVEGLLENVMVGYSMLLGIFMELNLFW